MEKILSTPLAKNISSARTLQNSDNSSSLPIVVFSHLRWESVTQRPQHLLTRLSKKHKILFVEEPIEFTSANRGTVNLTRVGANITVLQPRISWERLTEEIEPILTKYFYASEIVDPILWFYSPMFIGIVKNMSYSKIVYDCMDELSAFLGAPSSLLSHEQELLNVADIVFTGGKSLYESKRKRHAQVYCFPSSVDRGHFKKVFDKKLAIPRDILDINQPVVGFYGVIDERLDLLLLDQIAALRPEVSFVLIGPVVKIREESLPRHSNIHYLGKKSYEELPSYLKAFDIAMMPFALNDATRFISPTKTLEFMAAKKPIISTAIYDVVRDYNDVVSIVSSTQDFSDAITKYLGETETARDFREEKQLEIISKTSWNQTAKEMQKVISTNGQREEFDSTVVPSNT